MASKCLSRLFLVPWRAARAPITTWRTSQPPTTDTLRAACLARWSARPTRDALRPTPLAGTLLHPHRAGSAVMATNCRSRLFVVPWRAALARVAPWRNSRPTTHALRAACLAVLSARLTRDALHSTSLAETRLYQNRAGSEVMASNRCSRLFLVPWCAGRARVAPWRNSQPPTTHALHAACLARLSARPIRDALHPAPLAESIIQRHRPGSAAAPSNRRNRLFLVPWRAARAPVAPWRTSQPPTTYTLRAACLARLSARPTRDALDPTPWAGTFLHKNRAGSAVMASKCRSRLFLVPWRVSRARLTP